MRNEPELTPPLPRLTLTGLAQRRACEPETGPEMRSVARQITTFYEADIPAAIENARLTIESAGTRCESSGTYLHASCRATELTQLLGKRYTARDVGDIGETVALVQTVLEPNITVTVEPQDVRTASVADDLDELGVPEGEQVGVANNRHMPTCAQTSAGS